LSRASEDPYGYRFRDDRCEGVYITEVAAPALRVVSWTQSLEEFDPAAGKNLVMAWTAPGNAPVHLRAHALKQRLYYRMDAIRPGDSRTYSWPSNLLASLELRTSELGIVAWTSYLVGKPSIEVYLPLRVGERRAAVPSGGYRLVLLPGVELAEVFISVAHAEPNGLPGASIKKDEPLKHGYYPAEWPILITIAQPVTPGVYYVEIGATLRAGGSSTARIWFYQPGK